MLTARPTPLWRNAWADRSLPRDARDTLFLLANIAGVVALLSPHLPWWCSLMTLGVLLWRGLRAWRGQPLPGQWWRLGLLGVATAATLATHRTLLGQEAGVTLIVVLLALKTLELRARRDAFVVFFLGLFTLLTHFFYSQSLLTALGVLLATWGLLTSVVLAHMPSGHPPLWNAARTAGRMAVLGAPIMAALFVLFPRLSPLWGVPGDGKTGRTGLSSSMQVGHMADLAQDTSVALRVRFESTPPPSYLLYFRGPVLSHFDGREWQVNTSRSVQSGRSSSAPEPQSEPLRYEVTLEPNKLPWVLVLEATPTAPELPGYTLVRTRDLQWLADRPLTDLVRYRATSHLDYRLEPQAQPNALQPFEDLPPGYNPRTLALAQQWRQAQPQASAEQRVQQALTLLRTGGYTYTLAPGEYGQHTADEFWFDRKEGFCEHIASSFVILMRALDIPARVVTGYQGGDINPVDGYLNVRQSDAHAWAEVWLAGKGWVRVDPTGAVSPSRIQGPGRLTAPQGALAGALTQLSPTLIEHLRNTWEAVNNGWNQWVLNYSKGRQMDLLKQLGFEAPTWRELGYVLAGVVTLVSAIGLAWAAWERVQHDPWLRLLDQVRRAAERQGATVPPQATPRQLAALLQRRPRPVADPSASDPQALIDWLLALEAVRYAPPPRQTRTLAQLRGDWRRESRRRLRWPDLT
ncbi:transglutaminase TgpA family protein [Hydrogenophaga soli]